MKEGFKKREVTTFFFKWRKKKRNLLSPETLKINAFQRLGPKQPLAEHKDPIQL